MAVPKVWEAELANEDGIVWFRKTIDLPAGVTGKKARINLGAVDDEDLTYVNGVKVGEMNFWMPNRSYEIPAGVLKGGNNVKPRKYTWKSMDRDIRLPVIGCISLRW